MRHCVLLALFTVCVQAAALPAGAETFNVPNPYPTIQAGIDAASAGDTVLVDDGTYSGEGNYDLDFLGVNMVLTSVSGAEATVIDCGGLANAYDACSGEDSTSVVSGFTFTGGIRSNGAAIYVENSAPTIEDCIFTGNNASSNGGAIYYSYAPTQGFIRDCTFYGNTSEARGGAIALSWCSAPNVGPIIRRCVIYDNVCTAPSAAHHGGGGIHSNSSTPTIQECTIVGNAGAPGAGGIAVYSHVATVTNCVIAFNTSGGSTYGVTPDHCIIYQNVGDAPPSDGQRDNLDTDPLFCGYDSRDLRVCSDSPCIASDPENPWGERVGALGSGCGDCDTVVEDATWGSIKALFR